MKYDNIFSTHCASQLPVRISFRGAGSSENGGMNQMKHKQHMLPRLLCLAMALALLVPLSLPAKAASIKDTFGTVKDSFQRTLMAVAVKNGSEILVFTSSQEPINVGTTGSFSLDGNTAVAVEMKTPPSAAACMKQHSPLPGRISRPCTRRLTAPIIWWPGRLRPVWLPSMGIRMISPKWLWATV